MPGWCKGASWLLPATARDFMAFWRSRLAILPRLGTPIASARPPDGTSGNNGVEAEAPPLDIATAFDEPLGASNGWALGREMTETSRGMLLANPHYAWYGSERFWEKHLRIPGVLDVYGMSALGGMGVLIGFNEHVAWTHTISYGSRFTLYSLDLVPGHPTRYRYGDEEREMTPIDVLVEVLGEDAPVRRTLWSTHYGPVVSSGPFNWTFDRAYAIRDASNSASGLPAHLLGTARASSMAEVQSVHAEHQALPVLTTIAVDSGGTAWFIEAPSTPYLSDEALAAWQSRLETDSLTLNAWRGRNMVLDGSDPLFEWVDDPAAGKPGVVPFHRTPRLERTDYVFNSNDSFWLVNADTLLEGDYSPLHGPQRSVVHPRARHSALHLMNAAPDTPAGNGGRVDLAGLQQAAFANRSLTADLLVPELVARCQASPFVTIEDREIDLTPACAVLDGWDHRFDLDSRGAVLFREWVSRYAPEDLLGRGRLFAVDFDPDDPVRTPHTLAAGELALENLASAVELLETQGIALDAPLGELQYAPSKLPRRMAVHGGDGHWEGVLNLMVPTFTQSTLEPVAVPTSVEGSRFLTEDGYPVLHGTSFIMALEYTDDGPRANALLTYGQSGDPESEHFTDQTELFQRKEWRPVLFRQEDIEEQTIRRYEVTTTTFETSMNAAQRPHRLEQLADGWNTIEPGGETVCAHDDPFSFFVRRGDPNRLLVYLYGGGACWDAEGCAEGSDIYSQRIEPRMHPGRLGGILDLEHPENVFRDHTISTPHRSTCCM